MKKNFQYRAGLSSCLNRLTYTSVLSSALVLSSDLQAEESSRISQYTLQREKSPEAELSKTWVEQKPDVSNYTLHREKTAESSLPPPVSVKLPEIEIVEHGGSYRIKVVAEIDAPARYVRYVLTDYTHIYRLNPSIIESDVLERDDDGSVTVKTRVIGCAAYFCEELERVEQVQLLPSGDILAEIIPEQSQFKSGRTHWQIKDDGERCEVTYLSEMEPDIFIPPVVGKFLIKKSIRQEMLTSFSNLEKISSVLADREWQEDNQFADKCSSLDIAAREDCRKSDDYYLGVSE